MKTCTSINDFDRIFGMQIDLESRRMDILQRSYNGIYQTKERDSYRNTAYRRANPVTMDTNPVTMKANDMITKSRQEHK